MLRAPGSASAARSSSSAAAAGLPRLSRVREATVTRGTLLPAAVGSYRFPGRLALPGPRTARVLDGGSSGVSLADGGLGIFAGTGILAAVRCF